MDRNSRSDSEIGACVGGALGDHLGAVYIILFQFMHPLPKIVPEKKKGDEALMFNGQPQGGTILDFWRWSASDLLSNATRGIFAEFIVANAVQADLGCRDEWDDHDVKTHEGIRLEVKSSAYLQTWNQKGPSKIFFSVKTSRSWNHETGKWSDAVGRHVDAYVFCLLHHQDKATVDPLDLNQWEFYVVAVAELEARLGGQRKIGLSRLQALATAVPYDKLAETIRMKILPR